ALWEYSESFQILFVMPAGLVIVKNDPCSFAHRLLIAIQRTARFIRHFIQSMVVWNDGNIADSLPDRNRFPLMCFSGPQNFLAQPISHNNESFARLGDP